MNTDTHAEVVLPDAPPIAGLHFRNVTLDNDLAELVELVSVAHLADGLDWLPTVDNLRDDLQHPRTATSPGISSRPRSTARSSR